MFSSLGSSVRVSWWGWCRYHAKLSNGGYATLAPVTRQVWETPVNICATNTGVTNTNTEVLNTNTGGLVLMHFQAVISPRSITAKTDTVNVGRGLVFML